MIAEDTLRRPRPPYLHVLAGGESEITDFAWSLTLNSAVAAVRWLRGHKMQTVDKLFDEFAAALQFPYYFGENWPAFHECLTDLSWSRAGRYTLFIFNAAKLLLDEPPAELATLLRTLQGAAEEWVKPVTLGEAWDRPPIPFHVVFQCAEAELGSVKERLARSGADLDDAGLYTADRNS